jgi:hypothetical protein
VWLLQDGDPDDEAESDICGDNDQHFGDEALRRQWLLHGGPTTAGLQTGGRARPDDVDLFDLQAVRVVLRAPATRGDAQFEVRIAATRPLPAATPLPFLTLDVDVLGVVDVAAGRSLDFVTSEAGDRTDVLTAAPLQAGGVLTLLFEARFDALCTNPATCDADGAQGHLAQFGWFPASWAFPLTDRFAFSARIGAEGEQRSTATCAAAAGCGREVSLTAASAIAHGVRGSRGG